MIEAWFPFAGSAELPVVVEGCLKKVELVLSQWVERLLLGDFAAQEVKQAVIA